MEDGTPSGSTAITRPRLYGIVQTYIQKQLPRDIHPAFKALTDREEAAATLAQVCSTDEETALPVSMEQEQRSGINQIARNKDDEDDDVPL